MSYSPFNNTTDVNWTSSSLIRHQSTTDPQTIEDWTNLTLYVFDLGPKRDSLSSVIPITVIYIVILITGFVGNVCTCVVIIRNKHMHTATNYYLFSLAVSDLILLMLGLPQELYILWNRYPYVFGEAFCIIRGFTSETSTNASIMTITSFTMERYLAICHPLKAHTMSKLSRAIKLIIFVWIGASLCAIPLSIQFGIVFKDFNGERLHDTAECTLKSPLSHAFLISTFFFFFLPMGVISVLYVLIGIQLRQSESIKHNSSINSRHQQVSLTSSNGCKSSPSLRLNHFKKILSRHSSHSLKGRGVSSRKAVIKMLFAVVVAFFLCWAPFHAQRLMATYVRHQTPTAVMIYNILTYISGVTYYLSATINPILYSIMSNKFRQAFKDTLAHCCRKNGFDRTTSSRYGYSMYRPSVLRTGDNSLHNSPTYRHKKVERTHGERSWKQITIPGVVQQNGNAQNVED